MQTPEIPAFLSEKELERQSWKSRLCSALAQDENFLFCENAFFCPKMYYLCRRIPTTSPPLSETEGVRIDSGVEEGEWEGCHLPSCVLAGRASHAETAAVWDRSSGRMGSVGGEAAGCQGEALERPAEGSCGGSSMEWSLPSRGVGSDCGEQGTEKLAVA